jgi:integrase
LRVKDVEFDYQQLTIRDGKGAKDRVTVLPKSIVDELKAQTDQTAV